MNNTGSKRTLNIKRSCKIKHKLKGIPCQAGRGRGEREGGREGRRDKERERQTDKQTDRMRETKETKRIP